MRNATDMVLIEVWKLLLQRIDNSRKPILVRKEKRERDFLGKFESVDTVWAAVISEKRGHESDLVVRNGIRGVLECHSEMSDSL